MRRCLHILALLAVLTAIGGCLGEPPPADDESVVVFVLDSPVNADFMEGRVAGMRAEDVTHGSLVGRVLRSYCRARLVCVPVEDLHGSVSRDAYLRGLRRVLDYREGHPGSRILVNLSLASPGRDAREAEMVRRLAQTGVLMVAAAGNDDADAPRFPAAYDEVVAVASAAAQGKALGSNFGPHIDIAASGDITFIDYEFLPHGWLRRQMAARGTSFAAPRVVACIAYVLNRDPALSPRQAYEYVRSTTRPIDDPLFATGALGAGLLDIYSLKSAVAPGYRFVHFVLPVCIWIVLGVLTAFLCVRYELVGLFVSLMIWLIGLPLSVWLFLELLGYLEFVGGGSIAAGLGATGVLAAAAALAAMVGRWNLVKTGLALLPFYALFLVLIAVGAARGAGPLPVSMVIAAAALAAAFVLEAMTRRRMAALEALAAHPQPGEVIRRLLWSWRRTLDRRVRGASFAALARIAGREPEALGPWLDRFSSLPAWERDALVTVLEQAAGPGAVPLLESIAGQDPSGRLQELVERLSEEPPVGGSRRCPASNAPRSGGGCGL